MTDSALYSLQYLGGTAVWGSQLLGDNISIASQNAAAFADDVTYWMGVDSFYMYDGRVKALPCSLKRHVFNDINHFQIKQVFAGTNEGFDEVWWFYCSLARLPWISMWSITMCRIYGTSAIWLFCVARHRH